MRALRMAGLLTLGFSCAALARVSVSGSAGCDDAGSSIRADLLAGTSGATFPGFPIGYQLQFHGGIPVGHGFIPELGMELTNWSSGPLAAPKGGLFAGAMAGLRWTQELGCFRPWLSAHVGFPRLYYPRDGQPNRLVGAVETAIGLDAYFGGGIGLVVYASFTQNLWSPVLPNNYFSFGLGLVLAR
jgi:hypothetical protein